MDNKFNETTCTFIYFFLIFLLSLFTNNFPPKNNTCSKQVCSISKSKKSPKETKKNHWSILTTQISFQEIYIYLKISLDQWNLNIWPVLIFYWSNPPYISVRWKRDWAKIVNIPPSKLVMYYNNNMQLYHTCLYISYIFGMLVFKLCLTQFANVHRFNSQCFMCIYYFNWIYTCSCKVWNFL